MTGAMFIAECLRQEGVTKVFGQCGHTNYALIDACHKLGIEYVSFRHEQQAAHAADAYYRVSHKLAVVNVHLSPGLTNALTGVARLPPTARQWSSCRATRRRIHHAREPHQGIRFPRRRVAGRHLTAHLQARLANRRRQVHSRCPAAALNVAQTGRPGAVLLDVPMDVFSAQVKGEPATVARRPGYGARRRPSRRHRRSGASAEHRAGALSSSRQRRCRGGSVRRAQGARRDAAHPVATTLMGKGFSREPSAVARHDRHLGHAGRQRHDARGRRHRARRHGVREADCSSWDPKYTFAIPPSRLIQIDIDPQEIGKIYPVDVGIVGDAKATLRELVRQLRADPRRSCDRREVVDEAQARVGRRSREHAEDEGSRFIPPRC
jgi:acetolactate synthase-1/2/3 large subunit